MDIDFWTIYWITRLDGIQMMFGMAAILIAVPSFALTIAALCDDEWNNHKKYFINAYFISAFMIFGAVMTPDSKEYAAMLVIPALANNEDVQNIGSGIIDLANEWITELKPVESND